MLKRGREQVEKNEKRKEWTERLDTERTERSDSR